MFFSETRTLVCTIPLFVNVLAGSKRKTKSLYVFCLIGLQSLFLIRKLNFWKMV